MIMDFAVNNFYIYEVNNDGYLYVQESHLVQTATEFHRQGKYFSEIKEGLHYWGQYSYETQLVAIERSSVG
jgi:hypothetical protein